MTDKKEEFIEVDIPDVVKEAFDAITNLENHWSEPVEDSDGCWGGCQNKKEEIMYEEEDIFIRGLLTFHIDVYSLNANEMENEFIIEHTSLFDRLSEQGIEVLVLQNVKSVGDLGVRLEYISFE